MESAAKEAGESPDLSVAPEHPVTRPLHVLICVPALDSVKAGFAWSLANAMTYFAMMDYDGDKKVGLEICKSSNLVESRTRLVSRAFRDNATHVLFWDSDIKAPTDCIPAMLNRNEPIVAVNYPTKELHPRPTAYCDSEEYVGPLYTKEKDTGLVEVSHCGFGLMLVETKVFDALELPYFGFEPFPPDNVKTKGEDRFFCEKARAAGFKVMVDQDMSQKIAHIGDWEYTNQLAAEAETVRQALYRDLPG